MLPCRDARRTCSVQTSRAVVRVSGGCAPPASQFVHASIGAGRPPGHLLLAAVSGAWCWLWASWYFPVYGWASALTGGCQLAGGVPPSTAQLQRSPELLHTLITQHVPVCLSVCVMQLGPALLIQELGSGRLHRAALQFPMVHSQGHCLLVSGVPPDRRGWNWFP